MLSATHTDEEDPVISRTPVIALPVVLPSSCDRSFIAVKAVTP